MKMHKIVTLIFIILFTFISCQNPSIEDMIKDYNSIFDVNRTGTGSDDKTAAVFVNEMSAFDFVINTSNS